MTKGDPSGKRFVNQVGFSNTTTSVNSNKFGTFPIIELIKLLYFFSPSNHLKPLYCEAK